MFPHTVEQILYSWAEGGTRKTFWPWGLSGTGKNNLDTVLQSLLKGSSPKNVQTHLRLCLHFLQTHPSSFAFWNCLLFCPKLFWMYLFFSYPLHQLHCCTVSTYYKNWQMITYVSHEDPIHHLYISHVSKNIVSHCCAISCDSCFSGY